MKTVFINCSPKKRFSASAYFLALQRLFTGGERVTEKLRTPADHSRILAQMKDAGAVVFCLPLYVDGIPSHVLRFLMETDRFDQIIQYSIEEVRQGFDYFMRTNLNKEVI